MDREFKHPQIFSDVLTLTQIYYPMHNNFPKADRKHERLAASVKDVT